MQAVWMTAYNQFYACSCICLELAYLILHLHTILLQYKYIFYLFWLINGRLVVVKHEHGLSTNIKAVL